jgi:hypothetical protein
VATLIQLSGSLNTTQVLKGGEKSAFVGKG